VLVSIPNGVGRIVEQEEPVAGIGAVGLGAEEDSVELDAAVALHLRRDRRERSVLVGALHIDRAADEHRLDQRGARLDPAGSTFEAGGVEALFEVLSD